MKGTSRNSGFTLIEIMLALAIGSLLLGALYASLFGVIRGKERAENSMEKMRSVRSTLDIVRREISSAVVRQESGLTPFIIEDKDSYGKPASLFTLSVISSSSSGSLGDQQYVRYRPIEKNGKLLLYREVKSIFSNEDPISYPQLEEIESFLVECFDGAKWVKTWNVSLNGTLPARVRVTIGLKEGDSLESYTVTAEPKIVINR